MTIEAVRFEGDGVTLAGDAAGPADGAPLLFLHGGGQTRHSWRGALAEAAARGLRAIAIDLRGHGDSGWAPDGRYELPAMAADVRRVIAAIGRPPILIGASMGGMIGMAVGGDDAGLLRALVLVDVTARVNEEGAREIGAFMQSAPDGFASLDEAADAVAAYLPHRERPKSTDGLRKNLRLRGGRWHWHWDPALVDPRRIQAAQRAAAERPIEAAAARLTMPTLLIRGGRSRIVTEEGAREFLALVPHAEFVDIADADHMVAGDANDAFNEAVFAFVDRRLAPPAG